MAVKTKYTDKDRLFATPLPNHAATYTIISHQDIAEHAIRELNNAGFQITQEIYKSNLNGEVAYGIYNLDYSKDKDLSMMFAWANSYDKSRRFRCGIGAQVNVSNNAMLSADLDYYARKHTGAADQESREYIIGQVTKAVSHYEQLIIDKDLMLNKSLSVRQQSEILGVILHEKQIINLTQVALIQKELKRPSYNYSYDKDSAFLLYNHINHSLKDSHPAEWMDSHKELHRFFINEFGQISDRLVEDQMQVEENILQMIMASSPERADSSIIERIERTPVQRPIEKIEQPKRRTVVFC